MMKVLIDHHLDPEPFVDHMFSDTGASSTCELVYNFIDDMGEADKIDEKIGRCLFTGLITDTGSFLGHCLANRMEIMHEYGAALIYLTKKDYADFDIQRGDTEGIVNYMLMMKSIKVAAFITQQPSIVKISLRSKGDISVQEIASRHFKGGGHKNASGGAFYGKLSDVLDRFKRVIPDYLPKVEL